MAQPQACLDCVFAVAKIWWAPQARGLEVLGPLALGMCPSADVHELGAGGVVALAAVAGGP